MSESVVAGEAGSPEIQPASPLPLENPQLPGIEPAQNNEPTGKSETAPSTTLGEKIRAVGSVVFDKFGVPHKRNRGRPRNDGQPVKGSIPLADVPTGSPAPLVVDRPPTDPAVDSLFRRALISGAKGAQEIAFEIIREKASAAGIDDAFAETAITKAQPEAQVVKDFSDSLDLVCQKYQVKTEYAPEVALAINVGRIGVPFWFLLRAFNREIARKAAAEQNGGKKA